ncbi:MAG: hypothetical protein HeimC2_26150 [Candidatus Heimdallarchaeota archaeon LC_2]|nr:MAG: hypothetical protein HeimC2_26150 [Candidatus Heimdallarchaeota archaeon LC_2]
MTSTSIRKNDSLGSNAARLRSEMKYTHGKYNDLVSELAMLTKSELRPMVLDVDRSKLENGRIEGVNDIFGKIESVLFNLGQIHREMDEIVQNIGGLEFSTTNVVDKLSEIMHNQEKQHSRMFTELNHLTESLTSINEGSKKVSLTDFQDDVKEYQVTFSLFQDRVIESIPRISKVFDELDHEEEAGKRYGSTKQI